jgi:hypothetical protein
MVSINNIFQNGKYCVFFLHTVLSNTCMLLPSASLLFNDSSISLLERSLPDLIGLAVCVLTCSLASVSVRIEVSAPVLLVVSSFLLLASSFFDFLGGRSLPSLWLSLLPRLLRFGDLDGKGLVPAMVKAIFWRPTSV